MTAYCQAREQEAAASTAFSADSTYLAVSSVSGAISGYSSLPLFRDCDMRATKLRDSLYAQSSEWMGLGRYEDAASGFSALGDWQDSTLLQKYCRATALEEQAFYLEASELFSEIPEVLDAGSRAEAARAKENMRPLPAPLPRWAITVMPRHSEIVLLFSWSGRCFSPDLIPKR